MSETKKIVYEPAPCKGEGAEFSGQIILRLPSYEQRMEIMIDTDMIDLNTGKKPNKKESMQIMLKMIKASYFYYEKVDIKHKKSKTHYTSLEDLRYSPTAAPIINDVAQWLLNADGVGKS